MLKICCSFSRKVGEPDFGSRGASASLEVEVESALIQDLDQLRNRICQLYDVAKQAVNHELGTTLAQDPPRENGNGHASTSNGRPATQSQIRAIHAIANRHRLDLHDVLVNRFQLHKAEQLSLSQASELIDELKSQPSRNGGTR